MSSSCRRATLKDWWPDLSTGVCKMPEICQRWRVISAAAGPTFQTQFVSFQGSYWFTEKIFGVFVARFNARNIDLFPFDRHVVGFEDGLDGVGYLGADAVTFKALSMVSICEALELEGDAPGIKVVVYLPPNFVGLNISDWTVAIAFAEVS